MSDDNSTPVDDATEIAVDETPVTIAPAKPVNGRMTPGQHAACGQVITRAGVCRDARLKGRRCDTCTPIFDNEATAAAARRADTADGEIPAPAARRRTRKPRP
jgi:hypothetical protein